MEGDLTRGMASGAASSAGSMLEQAATALFFGSFNPKYKKEDRKRMRYIQAKYAQAYGDGAGLQHFFEHYTLLIN